MQPGLPHRPTFVMRLWVAKRFGWGGGGADASAALHHAPGKAMSLGSLEHVVRSRVKMFLRHTWLVTILGTIGLGAAVWATIYFTTASTMMRVAAGPPNSANARFVAVLAQKLERDRAKVRFEIVTTDGPRESAAAMQNGRADLAVLPSTVGNSPDWPVVAILRQNVMALIVPPPPAAAATPAPAPAPAATATSAATPAKKGQSSAGASTKSPAGTKSATPSKASKDAGATAATKDTSSKDAKATKKTKTAKTDDKSDDSDSDADSDSDSDDAGKLKKVAQLAGHRIGIVTGNEATIDMLDVVLSHYGITPDKVQIAQIAPKDIADAVRANKVDALFIAGSATGAAINSTVAAATQNGQAPTFIDIDQADGIAARDPAFAAIDIDAGTFGGNPPAPDDSLKSLKFPEYLVARKSVGHDAVGALAKLIYSSRLELASDLPGEVKIAAPSTDKDGDVTVHPGALAYLTDNQQSFFDKYGDDIFYGMLIFPVIGSAIAAVAGYLTANTRTRRLRLLQRVLDLVRRAHTAQSLEVLEQLQLDADNLVIAIIHQSEHEEFEETVRMSFSFALDQLRFAIAARRTAILDHVGGNKAAAA